MSYEHDNNSQAPQGPSRSKMNVTLREARAATNSQLKRYQAPAGRKSRTISTADKDGVVHVPNRRLAVARLVKDIVWFAIAVKVTCRHQFPAAGESRTVGTSDKCHAEQIPDRRLARAGVKQ